MRLAVIFSATLLLAACTNHNEDDYFKDNPNICYTHDVSFTQDIMPILEASCIGCHNSSNSSGNIDLSTHQAISDVAKSGKLTGSIKHLEGYSAMPPMGDKLDDCTISIIDAWIEQGKKNNDITR